LVEFHETTKAGEIVKPGLKLRRYLRVWMKVSKPSETVEIHPLPEGQTTILHWNVGVTQICKPPRTSKNVFFAISADNSKKQSKIKKRETLPLGAGGTN